MTVLPATDRQVRAADPIPLCAPFIGGNAAEYVQSCIDEGWVSSIGAFVDRFEAMFAERVGTRYAVATASGTAALHVALLVAGVEPDDEVLVSTLTFIAPTNAIRYAGAWPVFIDAEPTYWQMDSAAATAFLENECRWDGRVLRNRVTGRRVSAIVPVHILGHPVDMDPLLEIAKRFGLAIVEDATESLGATYRGRARSVGAIGKVGCFSFNGNKLITTGGGGMLVTDDATLAKRARYLTTQAKDDPIEYVHHAIGFNYRLTNLQAALGVAQLEQVDAHLAAKQRIAAAYRDGLSDVPGITLMAESPAVRSAWWMYTVLIDEAEFGCDSRALLRELTNRGIQTRPLWQPMHRSPAHAASQRRDCAVADRLYRDALSLPCSVGLTPERQQYVIEQIREIAQHADH